MEPIEIARKLAGYGERAGACKGYETAVAQGLAPEEELEAAIYILQFGGNYKVAYTSFLKLYRQGLYQDMLLPVLTEAFYQPNEKDLKKNYEKNCSRLKKYPYFFRKDFPAFEALPVRFYPYEDHAYIPFDLNTREFGDLIDFREPVIRHNFFHDLENPILAEDIFSQYELEYLNDNVRRSEYVAKENHIYLHYADWSLFYACLQCWDLRKLLADEKLVFLIGEEIDQYPIDFKARFGIDYSRYPVKPVGIREVSRLIWHTQLSAHNGGDFFNEVFDAHPNLLMKPSLFMNETEETVRETERNISEARSEADAAYVCSRWDRPEVGLELFRLRDRTEKDVFVALFLKDKAVVDLLDPNARIAPALFFQPHFDRMVYQVELDDRGRAALVSEMYDSIQKSPLFRGFKYIKTFTPMRRHTTSHGATVRFMQIMSSTSRGTDNPEILDDALFIKLLNRSFMIDPADRLYRDSRLVRFEDGKLNPRATFTALAAFLDLPYTESMTRCTDCGKEAYTPGNAVGFDPSSVYKTYDEYVNDAERTLIEFFLRDAYEYYGYGFQTYDGSPVDEARVKELIAGCTTMNRYIRESFLYIVRVEVDGKIPDASEEQKTRETVRIVDDIMEDMDKERLRIAKILLKGLKFVNRQGQPLRMMPLLEPDPALLEQPLYR